MKNWIKRIVLLIYRFFISNEHYQQLIYEYILKLATEFAKKTDTTLDDKVVELFHNIYAPLMLKAVASIKDQNTQVSMVNKLTNNQITLKDMNFKTDVANGRFYVLYGGKETTLNDRLGEVKTS